MGSAAAGIHPGERRGIQQFKGRRRRGGATAVALKRATTVTIQVQAIDGDVTFVAAGHTKLHHG